MNEQTKAELERRAAQGRHPSTLARIAHDLASIGYKLDRSGDCTSTARYVTGDHAGESYTCTTTSIRELDTGVSAWHYQDARRDANFKTLQQWRFNGELFAVINDSILEI